MGRCNSSNTKVLTRSPRPAVIQSTGVVVVVPKGKAAAKVWAAHFLDEAKADGTVRRALDGNGFTSDKIAP
ncbi:hypothetical protein [Bradyrhizobium betae]|uniref:hypothetical protein n=1 Tax=Bradyrhizobium betae TaxID=244734 RepID=UPI001FDEBC90|nr:hypothetical protein [Bradyrhizobium betae]